MKETGLKAAITACSNGRPREEREELTKLGRILSGLGITPVYSPFLYEKKGGFSGTAQEKAAALMDFYRDDSVSCIFDISGGELANELLPFLDFDTIAGSGKQFWGYSDLTVLINAILAKTGKASVLYQVRNLLYDQGESQAKRLGSALSGESSALFHFRYEFLQGNRMEGIVAGGNLRCLLKLAGTPYWPSLRGKILFLEAYSGRKAQLASCLAQLKQLGAFREAAGILLGTFTQLEREGDWKVLKELACRYAGMTMPVAKTHEIGHGTDSRAIVIGKAVCL